MAKLTKNQQEVWDRLKYVPPAVFQQHAVGSFAPTFPVGGSTFFNTTDAKLYVFDGSAWKAVS